MTKIMFVCHGNICRSPIAEFVFKDISKNRNVYINSKAVSREEIGNPIYPPAADVLRRNWIKFDDHRTSQITYEDYKNFDYIVVMEEYNMPRLLQIIGKDSEHKISRLLDFTSNPGDIEDPWYTGDFDKVYNQIRLGCTALFEHMKQKGEI